MNPPLSAFDAVLDVSLDGSSFRGRVPFHLDNNSMPFSPKSSLLCTSEATFDHDFFTKGGGCMAINLGFLKS